MNMHAQADTSSATRHRQDPAVVRESMRLRCTQAVHAVLPMTGALAVVGAMLWSQCPHDRLLAWLVTSYVATLVAAVDSRRILARLNAAADDALPAFNRRFLSTTLLNTAAMGAGIWWIGPVSAPEISLFVTLCVCFYAIGHTINGTSHLSSFLAGTFTNLAPTVVFWSTRGGEGVAIAVIVAGIAYLLATFGRQNARAFAENVLMRFENRDLLARLSEEKQTVESALAQAEEANLAKSRFLAAASHDLRQPLHALGMWASLLRESVDTPAAIERADKLNLSVESLERLLSGLLDLSRLDARNVTFEKRPLPLQQILRALENDCRAPAEAKGLAFSVQPTAAWVHSDPVWLDRVLRNLLGNAVKYTQRGSVALACEETEGTVRVVVRDTGIGIPQSELDHIFEAYYQVGNRERNRDLGVGLGLAIVKHACTLLGHDVEVASTPGAGSAFSVVLPRVAAGDDGGATRVAGVALDALHGVVVVVVEDDAALVEAMREMLAAWGCVPVVADSGDSAIALLMLQGLAPDVAVADYRLAGGTTGVDAIAALRERYGPVPALLVTGEYEARGLAESHRDDYPVLQKPVSAARLKEALTTSLTASMSRPEPAVS